VLLYFKAARCRPGALSVASGRLGKHDPTERRSAVSGIRPEVADLEDDADEAGDGTETVRAKWTIDGAATLAEAAQKARDFADFLQSLHDQGYVLDGPVADDYGFYR
jgi:hypothetical protein